MIELVPIGHSAKSRGIDGSFKTRIVEEFRADLLKARAIFINLDGSKVPFLIESSSVQNGIILKLDEIDTPESVTALLNKELFLEISEVSDAAFQDNTSQHPLTGFFISDQNDKKIAPIEELIEYPNQLLAKINFNDKELLLPIHEKLIIEMDEQNQTLKLEIAEGLLDL